MLVRSGRRVKFYTVIRAEFVIVYNAELSGRYLKLSHIMIIPYAKKKGKRLLEITATFLGLTAIFPLKKRNLWYIMLIGLLYGIMP